MNVWRSYIYPLKLGGHCETHLVAFVIPSIGVIRVSDFHIFEDGCYDLCNTCKISFILKGEEMGWVKLRGFFVGRWIGIIT